MVNILVRVKEGSTCFRCGKEFTETDDVVLVSSWRSMAIVQHDDCKKIAEAEKLAAMKQAIEHQEAKTKKLKQQKENKEQKEVNQDAKTKESKETK